jgi:signal recognition particle GTPase
MSLESSPPLSPQEIGTNAHDLVQRIEQLEQHQRLIARSQQNFLDIFEKTERQQEQLVRAQEILTHNQSNLVNAVKQLADSQLQLTRFVERLEDRLVTTNAAIEHLDRLVDYVMRERGRKQSDRSPDEE